MNFLRNICLISLCVAFAAISTFAQETETKVVDEVVAQVNEGVITLSRVRREAKDIVDAKVEAGAKREDAQKEIDDKQGEMIANLINEELLIQKAKELGFDNDIEATLNQRFVEIMKQYDLKTLDALYDEMRKQNVDPQEMREIWRKQATRDRVIQREVQSKLYWGYNAKQLKDYYEKHKEKFTKQETISLSEIFLNFAGRDEATVREKAKALVAQLRAGGDFAKAVVENSDRPDAAQTKGKVPPMPLKDLDAKFATALKDVKVGGVSDPIEADATGVTIVRIDDRTAGSNESEYNEDAVRAAKMNEDVMPEQKKFMAELRENSYIKISETYRPVVSPILFADERKAKPGN